MPEAWHGVFLFYRARGLQHFIPQSAFIYDNKDNLLVDDVFRFEELDSLLPTLKQKCPQLLGKANETKLVMKNQMKKCPQFILNESTRQQIKLHYARDYRLLNY